jgi:hypothetical protein
VTCGEVAYLRMEVEPELGATRFGRPVVPGSGVDWVVHALPSGWNLGFHAEPDLPNATLTVLIPGGWRHDATARARVEGVVRRFGPAWEASGVVWDAAVVDAYVRFSFCGPPGATAQLLRAGAEVFEPVELASDLAEPWVDNWPRRVRHALDHRPPTESIDWRPEGSVWSLAAPSPPAAEILDLARATLDAPWLAGQSRPISRRTWTPAVPPPARSGERVAPVGVETTLYLWTLPGGFDESAANAEIAAAVLAERVQGEGWLGCAAVPSAVETAVVCAFEGPPPAHVARRLASRFRRDEVRGVHQAWLVRWSSRYDPTPVDGDCLTAHAARSMWTLGTPALGDDLPGPGGARALQRAWLSRERLGVVVLRPEGD